MQPFQHLAPGVDQFWSAQLIPPSGQLLARGVYANLPAIEPGDTTTGAFEFGGDGRACGAPDSTSTVVSYTISVSGYHVSRLLATFEQHCAGTAQPTYGIIDFTS